MAACQPCFTERVVRTRAVELIQVTCLGCGFIAVGKKDRLRAVETEHKRHCRGDVLVPKIPAKPSGR
jgi:hypothetical protein